MGVVARLVCGSCHAEADPAAPPSTCHLCHGVLEAQLDLGGVTRELALEIRQRPRGLWRWREFLPVQNADTVVSLGEGDTPLIHARRLGADMGLERLYLKNDTLLPTGSLKDRSVTVAISHAREVKASTVAVCSTGNHAASVAAYAAAAGVTAVVMVPAATATSKVTQARACGATVVLVNGSFDRTAELFREAIRVFHWYPCLSTNPWRNEGKKTYAFETWEALDGEVPAWMIHPIAGGLGVTANWKGWAELNDLGWARGLPRLVVAQAAAAAPIVRAWKAGLSEPVRVAPEPTVAESIAVGAPTLGARALQALRATDGIAVACSDDEIISAQADLARREGVFCEPAAATSVAAARVLRRAGRIRPHDLVVCTVTGHGLKQPDAAALLASAPIAIGPSLRELERHFPGCY